MQRAEAARPARGSVSRDGSGMNARSKPRPSPLTSPCTTGVNGSPDCARANSVITPILFAAHAAGHHHDVARVVLARRPLALARIAEARAVEAAVLPPASAAACSSPRRTGCRDSRNLKTSGDETERELPAVAAQVAHARRHAAELAPSAATRSPTPRRSSDRSTPADTNTGRLPSAASAKRCAPEKLASTTPGWFRSYDTSPPTRSSHLPHVRRPVERRAPAARHVVARDRSASPTAHARPARRRRRGTRDGLAPASKLDQSGCGTARRRTRAPRCRRAARWTPTRRRAMPGRSRSRNSPMPPRIVPVWCDRSGRPGSGWCPDRSRGRGCTCT